MKTKEEKLSRSDVEAILGDPEKRFLKNMTTTQILDLLFPPPEPAPYQKAMDLIKCHDKGHHRRIWNAAVRECCDEIGYNYTFKDLLVE